MSRAAITPTNEPLPPDQQRAALQTVLQTLRPEFLELPAKLVLLLPPRPQGYPRDRETFAAHTGLVFDPLAAAKSRINTELDLLLTPERLAWIVEQNMLPMNEFFDAIPQTA